MINKMLQCALILEQNGSWRIELCSKQIFASKIFGGFGYVLRHGNAHIHT